MERHEMTTTFRHNRQSGVPSTGAFHAALLLAVVALIFASGCRAPLVNKEWHIVIYQTGLNSVTSDILKEEEIAPQIKASLK